MSIDSKDLVTNFFPGNFEQELERLNRVRTATVDMSKRHPPAIRGNISDGIHPDSSTAYSGKVYGLTGRHSCLGRPYVSPTEQEMAALDDYLAEAFGVKL